MCIRICLTTIFAHARPTMPCISLVIFVTAEITLKVLAYIGVVHLLDTIIMAIPFEHLHFTHTHLATSFLLSTNIVVLNLLPTRSVVRFAHNTSSHDYSCNMFHTVM